MCGGVLADFVPTSAVHVQRLAGQGEVGLAQCFGLGRVGVHQRGHVLGQGLPVVDQLRLADQLADSVTDISVINGKPVEISLSIGTATGPPTAGLTDLLARADAAMYRHKHSNRTPIPR